MPLQFVSLKEILEKDIAHGGKTTLIVGKPNAGKTGLLHGIASRLIENEICIFRGMPSGQEFRFPGHLKTLAFQCKPQFFDTLGNLVDIKVKVINTNYDDLLQACELGKLNVIYFPFDRERAHWVEFCQFLVNRFPSRYASNYISLFLDEFEDILPSPELSGPGIAKNVREFLGSLKEFRKNLISMYAATQQFYDIHWRGMGKINYRIFLRGAFVPKREMRVDQNAVDGLPIGRGILSGSFFGYFEFANYPTRELVLVRM